VLDDLNDARVAKYVVTGQSNSLMILIFVAVQTEGALIVVIDIVRVCRDYAGAQKGSLGNAKKRIE
jgi:hypothetical protein